MIPSVKFPHEQASEERGKPITLFPKRNYHPEFLILSMYLKLFFKVTFFARNIFKRRPASKIVSKFPARELSRLRRWLNLRYVTSFLSVGNKGLSRSTFSSVVAESTLNPEWDLEELNRFCFPTTQVQFLWIFTILIINIFRALQA